MLIKMLPQARIRSQTNDLDEEEIAQILGVVEDHFSESDYESSNEDVDLDFEFSEELLNEYCSSREVSDDQEDLDYSLYIEEGENIDFDDNEEDAEFELHEFYGEG